MGESASSVDRAHAPNRCIRPVRQPSQDRQRRMSRPPGVAQDPSGSKESAAAPLSVALFPASRNTTRTDRPKRMHNPAFGAPATKRVQAASMGGGGVEKSGSAAARVLGSGAAGVLELALFHPVDTVAKRLMSYEGRVIVTGQTMTNLNQAIFKQKATAPVLSKYLSLFPGITFGAAYKVLQRAYKFGGQPFVRDIITRHYGQDFDAAFGKRNGKTMIYATAGSIMGVGEIVLLPLDVLKIKAQTNPESLQGRGLFKILAEEGMGLYRGAAWTAARNAPGSFALFGGSAVVKDKLFKLEKYSDATFMQDSIASVAGAVASITVAQPLDVIKTRIQKRDFTDKTSGTRILTDLVKNEGLGAFFKGLTPKLVVIGPKLVFSFTVAQQLMGYFEGKL